MKTWLRNFFHVHERFMMRFLRRRGWVVFSLEEKARTCKDGVCWMKLYNALEGKKRRRGSTIREDPLYRDHTTMLAMGVAQQLGEEKEKENDP